LPASTLLWYYPRAVHLFLILSAPLAQIYLLTLRDETNQRSVLTIISSLKGVLAYLVVLVPMLAMDRFLSEPFGGSRMYFYNAVYDYAAPLYLGMILYLWFTNDVLGLTPQERFVSFSSFLAGMFTLAGAMDLFVRADYFGTYELFLLPALRIGLVGLAASLYYLFSAQPGWIRLVYLLLLLALPLALGTVPLLMNLNYAAAAAGVTVFLFLSGWAMALFAAGSVGSLRVR